MFACSFNKYALSSLSLALLSVGFLSCGGGGDDNSGSCLPVGSQLNMIVPIINQVDQSRGSFPIQLTGNGSDVPVASLGGAGQDPSNPTLSHVVYRRTSPKDATLDGQFELATGQYTIPGPIIITTYDKMFVSMQISYNASSTNETTTGTCTGTLRLLSYPPNGVGDPVLWIGTEGTVGYYSSFE